KVEGCILADMMDRWFWALEGSGEFTITAVRKMIDDFMLPDVSFKTRWIKAVPIKVNVHAWKVKLDGLPTRLNISRKGIDIESILCSMCGKAVESTSRIFFTCQMSKEILRKIFRWWDIDYMEIFSYEECTDGLQCQCNQFGDAFLFMLRIPSKGRYLDVVKYEIFSRALLREGHLVSETAKVPNSTKPPHQPIEKGFLTPKGKGRSNCVKEKQINMADVSAKANDSVDLDTTSTHTNQAPLKPRTGNLLMGGLSESSKKELNSRTLHASAGNGVDVVISKESISIVNKRFYNYVYGFFYGKRVAFLVVENYIKNVWSKCGLVRSMMTINGMFFFKFSSNDEMNWMLESCPWLIRNVPLILKKKSPDANIIKDDVCNVPVWVKFNVILITAFTKDSLSAIVTKLGTPLMLDSYMIGMCLESWGGSSYARAMIEL
nr:RNA-directed DNA polymerase, eukaryota, reverse transcriptase zinc-binding domain protein [Tanacetum cinerariifolium]